MIPSERACSRRNFLVSSAWALAAAPSLGTAAEAHESYGLVDIHQHTHYHARSDDALLRHQRAMGIQHTILLPAGRLYGLAAQCGDNQNVVEFCRAHPREFSFC